MQELSAIVMVISAGLFAAGLIPIAWERAPAWRADTAPEFRRAFEHTLRRMDRLQPLLLMVCIASAIRFATTAAGVAGTLAVAAVVAAGGVLLGSGVAMLPIQRRLAASGPSLTTAQTDRMRDVWLRRHLVRTVIGVVVFVLLTTATVVEA